MIKKSFTVYLFLIPQLSLIGEKAIMKLFNCQKCGQILMFENTLCEQCHSPLGFIANQMVLSALIPKGDCFLSMSDEFKSQKHWRYCENKQHNACNWLVDDDSDETFCEACELNRHIPNLGKIEELQAWQKLEFAKHRLVYSLLKLNLPLISKQDEPETGLSFDFISENNVVPEGAQSMTGHAFGQVTINAVEANSSDREQIREDLQESYRTLIGHFRHEVGHYYWDQLILPNPLLLTEFRTLFGDERADYSEALEKHYDAPVENWQENHVSVYASSHPWEDWAETWAHYLHIVDTLETAIQLGFSLYPTIAGMQSLALSYKMDPYQHEDFEEVIAQYLPLAFAINNVNRSMGQPDLYPFILVPAVREKLSFIHKVLSTK